MMDMENYECERFGDLLIPFYDLHENPQHPYEERDVVIRKKPNTFEIPDSKVRSFKDRLIEMKKADALKNKRVLFDSPTARLAGFSVNDDQHTLYLDVQDTTYFTNAATNKSLDVPEVRRMIEERGSSLSNLDDGLANSIGVSVNILSRPDNCLVIIERSQSLDQYPDLLGLPAGFFNPQKHNYSPFNTGRMEVEEEIGVPIEKIRLFGVGRAGDDRHGEILMTAETPYTKEKILSAPKTAKWEGKITPSNIVPFEPDKLMKLMTKTIKEEPKGVPKGTGAWVTGRSPAWVPAAWEALKTLMVNEFDFDEVWNAYEETRRNH
jgi:ADP-ribose pyrophosphatase YjhB (NUDIX family)